MRNLVVALLTLTSGVALAQATEQQPSSTAPASSGADTTAQPAPSTEDRLTTAEGKVASLEEQNTETKSDLSALKKIKLSGYVQGRYQFQEDLEDTNQGGFSRFTVRRGRIKATYTGDLGQAVVQIDAVPSGVTLRDAEATLFIPGTRQNMALTLGQTKWPFGYEAPQSSSDREFPERSRVVGAFLPSERDRGLKFNGRWNILRIHAGLFDGNGTSYRGVGGVGKSSDAILANDNDKEKDLIGRVGFDAGWISGGLSGWYGQTIVQLADDENRKAYDRTRVGADVQVYLDLIPLGGTALKAEYITGRSYQRGGLEQVDVPASGWWALIVQNIGLSNALAVRYDYFDPQNGSEPSEANGVLGANNPIGTLGIAAIHHFGESLKLTAAYELPMTETAEGGTAKDPKDNLLTVQLQARF